MSRDTSLVVIIVVLVMVVLALLYFLPERDRVRDGTAVDPGIEIPVPPADAGAYITAMYQFKEGTHIIAGELDLPTPCHVLDTATVIRESFPEQVTIEFNISRASDEPCAQVIVPTRFKVLFEASKQALITATLNGESVVLNLLRVREGENIEDL